MSTFTVAKVIAYNEENLRGLAENMLGDIVHFSLPHAPIKNPVGSRLCVNHNGCVQTLDGWVEETKSAELALSRANTLALDCE